MVGIGFQIRTGLKVIGRVHKRKKNVTVVKLS